MLMTQNSTHPPVCAIADNALLLMVCMLYISDYNETKSRDWLIVETVFILHNKIFVNIPLTRCDFIRVPYMLGVFPFQYNILTNFCLFKNSILYVKDVIPGKSLRMNVTTCALCLKKLTCMNSIIGLLVPSGGTCWIWPRGTSVGNEREGSVRPQAPTL